MTDCDCPCHGDSEEGASHEDGDCCPALAEADEALADMLVESEEERREAMAEWLATEAPVLDITHRIERARRRR